MNAKLRIRWSVVTHLAPDGAAKRVLAMSWTADPPRAIAVRPSLEVVAASASPGDVSAERRLGRGRILAAPPPRRIAG